MIRQDNDDDDDDDLDDDGRNLALGDVFFATDSESGQRAGALLPMFGSEDASAILRSDVLPRTRRRVLDDGGDLDDDDDERDYAPTPEVDWIVDVRAPGSTFEIETADLDALLSPQIRRRLGAPTVYGLATATGRWTYVGAGGAPTRFRALQLGYRYAPHAEEHDRSAAAFRRYLDGARRVFGKLGPVVVEAAVQPFLAAQKSASLVALREKLRRHHVDVIASAPDGGTYDGRAVWDVMMSLGLEWGDMDCFHLHSPSEEGDDYTFSVSTSTPPGYFFPEEIAAGRVAVQDLVLSFSPARSVDPREALRLVVAAARYMVRRLGGAVLDETGAQLDENEAAAAVDAVCALLAAEGFRPGSHASMTLV